MIVMRAMISGGGGGGVDGRGTDREDAKRTFWRRSFSIFIEIQNIEVYTYICPN